jgi:prepilin-type N-terminal cleavage/methylation domain-containing protein
MPSGMAETATPFPTPAVAGAPALRPTQAGFTLTEVLVVAAVIAVGFAVSIPVTMEMVTRARNDSSVVVAHTFIDAAHDRAVAERRNIELTFQAPDRILMERIEVPSGLKTLVGELRLEAGQEFLQYPGVSDTPDAFGSAAAVAFTGTLPVMFTSDGSLIDSAGDVTNGTLFMGVPNHPETARAVTIFGVTGMLRTWKWRGASWLP